DAGRCASRTSKRNGPRADGRGAKPEQGASYDSGGILRPSGVAQSQLGFIAVHSLAPAVITRDSGEWSGPSSSATVILDRTPGRRRTVSSDIRSGTRSSA